MKSITAVGFWMLFMLPTCHAQLSSYSSGCEGRLSQAEERIFPKQPLTTIVIYAERDFDDSRQLDAAIRMAVNQPNGIRCTVVVSRSHGEFVQINRVDDCQ